MTSPLALWRECFTRNPLLPVEWRRALRPWWGSPLRWALIGSLLILLSLVASNGLWHLWVDGVPRGTANARMALSDAQRDSFGNTALQILTRIGRWASTLLPLWGAARAWSREREPDSRLQLAVTPLTSRQLLLARMSPWIWCCVFAAAVDRVALFLLFAMRQHAVTGRVWPDDSNAFTFGLFWLGYSVTSSLIWILLVSMAVVKGLPWFAVAAGVSTLVWWGTEEVHGQLARGVDWLTSRLGLHEGIYPPDFSQTLPIRMGVFALLLLAIVLLWNGFHRQIKRTYGMN